MLVYIERLLRLAGESDAAAQADAGAILGVETALAKASLTRVERRDPHATYHVMTVGALAGLTPAVKWDSYFALEGAPGVRSLNVSEPAFMRAVQVQLATAPVAALRAYLRFHLLSGMGTYLAKPYREANFDFYSKTLRGVAVMPARWKTCTRAVEPEPGRCAGGRSLCGGRSARI